MWSHLIPELLKENVLCVTDLHNVEAFCVSYDKWRTCEESVREHGVIMATENGSFIKNPALTAANEALRQISTYGSVLGLDPSSRSRLIGAGKQPTDNPFTDLL